MRFRTDDYGAVSLVVNQLAAHRMLACKQAQVGGKHVPKYLVCRTYSVRTQDSYDEWHDAAKFFSSKPEIQDTGNPPNEVVCFAMERFAGVYSIHDSLICRCWASLCAALIHLTEIRMTLHNKGSPPQFKLSHRSDK